MLFTHFFSSRPKSGFHVWGSLQRMKKTKIEKGNLFLYNRFDKKHQHGNNFKYWQKLIQAESTMQPDK